MKEIKLCEQEIYADASRYQFIDSGIYRDILDENDTCFRMTISFELEEDESIQYPLEDILDEYYLHVSAFVLSNGSFHVLELSGELEDIQKAKAILGKRIRREIALEDGIAYRVLKIE